MDKRMLVQREYIRAAILLFKVYGDGAVTYATARVGDLRREGDKEGEERWMLILKLLGELTSEERPTDATVH